MNHSTHDYGIERNQARKGQVSYGMGLGIILLEDVYPGFPGDVRKASGYPYPIQYDVVENIDIKQLVYGDSQDEMAEAILASAKRLEKLGVRAIAAECGYFAYYQKTIAENVNIPVFMSSLLQVPLAQQVVGINSQVGILCASKERLSPAHLKNVGIDPTGNIVIAGRSEDYESPEFDSLWVADKRPEIPESTYSKAEASMIRMSKDFVAKNPKIKALVFECTRFQPFARAVQ